MSRFRRLAFKVFNKTLQRNSNWIFQSILKTPPSPSRPDADTVLYTVLNRRNVRAYLLAVKSFLRFCPQARVVVQSDGSMGPAQVRELEEHVPGVEVYTFEESLRLVNAQCEARLPMLVPLLDRCHFFLTLKLLAVVFRFPGRKVVLFDSDLLFLRDPPFVNHWVRDDDPRPFHSDGGNGLSTRFRTLGFEFPRVRIEMFNAGFFGFKNTIREDCLNALLERIQTGAPDLLTHWEIEQACWSVLLNEFPDPLNLEQVEHDYVASGYWPYDRLKHSVLVHFVGSRRFQDLSYLRLARQVSRQLKDPSVFEVANDNQ